ncbi:hypothetical protein [Pararhizobium antarcticum]|uniref:hypothetical protein n=1 Tax=Pararhizobium antarcticum TaxID=1798805 RepID=UPI000B140FC4|nr:hypothetical protein [Pararhizobium antarcticum]
MRLFLLAVMMAVPLSAQAADAVIRKAGRYILLLDGEGKPVAGSYWLSPALKISVHSRKGALPTDPEFRDRDFFPMRRGAMLLMANYRYSYSPEPSSVGIGQTQVIARKATPIGPLAAMLKSEDLMIRYSFHGTLGSRLDGIDLINHFYTIERNDLEAPDAKWGKRVYIETLDMDLSDDDAARVASIASGEALSSGDFYVDYLIRVAILPDLTRCLEEKRKAPDYPEKARRQRDGSDAYMAEAFPGDGMAFWEKRPSGAPDEQAMNVYRICPSDTK